MKDCGVNMSINAEDFEEDQRPLRSPRRQLWMRIVVSVAIAALVLPGVLITWTTQARTAAYACNIAVAYYAPGATDAYARFDITNPSLIGWNCYAGMFNGEETFVAHLGVIPGAPRLIPLTGA